MSSNEMRQLIAHLPEEVAMDLMRYGISLPATDGEEPPLIPQEPDNPVSTDGGEIIDLPTEVVICDYPITGNWCEVVPRRTYTPPVRRNQEKFHDHIAC